MDFVLKDYNVQRTNEATFSEVYEGSVGYYCEWHNRPPSPYSDLGYNLCL